MQAVHDATRDARAARLVAGVAQDAVNLLVETTTLKEHNATMRAADEAEQATEDVESVLEATVIAMETAIAVEAAAHSETEATTAARAVESAHSEIETTYSGDSTRKN